MKLNINQSIKRTLANAGIPVTQELLGVGKPTNPMADYQSRDYSKLERAHAGLEKFLVHVVNGQRRGLIITGPAGSGKTSSVLNLLAKHTTKRYKSVSGMMSPIRIYEELYRHKNHGEVIVLDDVDSVYSSVEGMNVIKAAADTLPQRKVCWLTASPRLKAWGIPSEFEYNGAIVLISNEPPDAKKSSKLGNHLKAIVDRLAHVRMGTNDKEEQFHQLCYHVVKHGLLRSRGLTATQEAQALQYITDNFDLLPSISLRTAAKIAELMLLEPDSWRDLAAISLLSNPNEYI